MNKRYATLLAMLILLVVVSVASAGEQVYQDSIPLQPTNWSHVLQVPKFDPTTDPDCNVLTSVEVTLDGHVEGSAAYENTGPSPATITLNLQADIEIQRPNTTTLVLSQPLAQVVDNATAYDNVLDFDGDSGGTFADLSGDVSETQTFTDLADLLLFMGSGTIDLPVSATGSSSSTGSGNVINEFITNASADITIKYSCGVADWGDAPDPSYPTLLVNDGPRHIVSNIMLGSIVDTEADGQPDATATGDDNAGSDDEDGVERTTGFNWYFGLNEGGSVDVYPNGNGCLSAWVDWDNNGNFTDGFDQIIDNAQISGDGATAVTFDTFTVPVDPTNNSFFARFRFYPEDAGNTCTSAKSPTGITEGGEVEDYIWGFSPTAVNLQTAKASSNGSWQTTALFTGLVLLTCTILLYWRKRIA